MISDSLLIRQYGFPYCVDALRGRYASASSSSVSLMKDRSDSVASRLGPKLGGCEVLTYIWLRKVSFAMA